MIRGIILMVVLYLPFCHIWIQAETLNVVFPLFLFSYFLIFL